MAEDYLKLSREERLEALGVAATQSGRPVHVLEKDIWVVWAIGALFAADFGKYLVFKGGTSLSKAYAVIGRFSEDVDVTYDIRQVIPELIGSGPPIPPSNAKADKWRKAIDKKLRTWVQDGALSAIGAHIKKTAVDVMVSVESTNIFIDYDPLAEGKGYVAPRVKLEFGARSTGEPCEERAIACVAAGHLPDLAFPSATPRVMLSKRTFWEKATAVHVYCLQGGDGDRYSRHWHDLVRLDEAGHAQEALDDPALAKAVADHKTRFFREKDKKGERIDYDTAVSGGLKLIPEGEALKRLEADYAKMAEDGILLDDAEPFSALVERCAALEKRANER